MSETNNRVRISFTVDMDEVPARVAELVRQYEDPHAEIERSLVGAVTELTSTQPNYRTAWESIDEARKRMMRLDLILQDCQEILNDFQSVLLGQNALAEPVEEQHTVEAND